MLVRQPSLETPSGNLSLVIFSASQGYSPYPHAHVALNLDPKVCGFFVCSPFAAATITSHAKGVKYVHYLDDQHDVQLSQPIQFSCR